MDVEEAIFRKLTTDADVSALVGRRVYFTQAEEPVQPYIIMQRISVDPGTTRAEASGADEVLVQLACFASEHGVARSLVKAVIAALDSVVLANGDNPTFQDSRSDYDEVVGLYRCDADFLV